jgi:hypothetical protein
MKLPVLFASALIAAGALTLGAASAAPLSSSLSLKNVNAGQTETVRYRRHHRYSHRAYRSFAFAPGFRSNRNFGAARTCRTIRPWKDEEFNSAFPSRRCQ